ncbi:MAG: NifU family protein [Magnetovibrio sp.]|nr:NifU family protein [Magnetovibrio sp.]
MFIQTEATPNPATLKFLPGQAVMPSGTANFTDAESAANSPLALRLFEIEGVDGIFLGGDFVTVTKADDAQWDVVKPRVLAAVMDHFTQGLDVITVTEGEDAGDDNDSDTVKQIKELIETRVRPAVAQDGGDIVFRSFEEGVVYLHMQGACAGCPSSTATLKNGIENMLRHFIPEVQEVRAVN